ncbi:NAD-dependent epimerase/dehydratase family protein [Pseudothioclava nitratireducens]|uniref:NAD-dependent epimerase/dehydratase family protein n=1 Tax=Pseudothioclava nitratireducens TaxID=1928646 RepID=UPI0023DAFED7|nr:NAD(P)-dependent oxidoreductase [Defluviimonas nitratireducens]MDF1621709.1 NAD(P)-dependent oxidoreductase [Defluviimonas nitratireducens]
MDTEPHLLGLPRADVAAVVAAVGPLWQRLAGQRLLLTGGTGFIGKWLLASFLEANRSLGLGARVLMVSRRPEVFLAEYPDLAGAPEVEWWAGDVRDFTPADATGCTFAIHAATDVVASSTPAEILDTCITGTSRVLEAMSPGEGTRRVLLLSSGAVYGRAPEGVSHFSEDWPGAPDPLSPSSAYGEGKRASELLAAIAANQHPGLEVAIARCFAFVGPLLPLDKHFAIGNFIASAMAGEDIRISGDGTPLRSYLYAGDLAHWLWVMLFEAPSGRAYNVGSEDGLSIADLAHRVNTVLGGTGAVRVAKSPQSGAAPQPYLPSVARIRAELKLSPTVGLDDAIRRTAHWAKEEG